VKQKPAPPTDEEKAATMDQKEKEQEIGQCILGIFTNRIKTYHRKSLIGLFYVLVRQANVISGKISSN